MTTPSRPSARSSERRSSPRRSGSKLLVISVAPLIIGIGRSAGPIDSTDPPAKHAEELKRAHEYLEAQGISAELTPAVGDPADTIVDLAQDRGGRDLIVVGTREPNFIARVLGQSVSESVSHKAHCDVLIVH